MKITDILDVRYIPQLKEYNFVKIGKLQFALLKGVAFKCTGCGNCCYTNPACLTDLDIRNIKKFLKKNKDLKKLQDNFLEKKPVSYIDKFGAEIFAPSGFHLKKIKAKKRKIGDVCLDTKCIFLSDENKCLIYKARPSVCKCYPFTFNTLWGGIYVAYIFEGVKNNNPVCNGFFEGTTSRKVLDEVILGLEESIEDWVIHKMEGKPY